MSKSRFWDLFEKFQRFYSPMSVNGFCHGNSYMAMLALVSTDVTAYIHRLEHIYFGFPHPTQPDKRIQLSDLNELVKVEGLDLAAEKDETIEHKSSKKTTIPHATLEEIADALQKFVTQIKAEDFPQTTPKQLVTLPDSGKSMQTITDDLKPISRDELHEQYKTALKIRAAYIKKIHKQLQAESKGLPPAEIRKLVAQEKEKFDNKYPYISGLCELATYFVNISFFQDPEDYRYLTSGQHNSISHNDLEKLFPLLEPVKLDKKTAGEVQKIEKGQPKFEFDFISLDYKAKSGVQKIDEVCHLYSMADIQSTLQSLAAAIEFEKATSIADDQLPLGIILSSQHHSITLGYKDKQWILINANNSFPELVGTANIGFEVFKNVVVLPSVAHQGTNTTVRLYYNKLKKQFILYDAIHQGVPDGKEQVAQTLLQPDVLPKFTDLKINIALRIYGKTSAKKPLQQMVSTWRESKEFIEAHKITDAHITAKDDIFNVSLLAFACKEENLVRAAEYIAHGVAQKYFVSSDSTQVLQVQTAMARLCLLLKHLSEAKKLAMPTEDAGIELLLELVKLGLYKIAKSLVIPQTEHAHLLQSITNSFCDFVRKSGIPSMRLISETLSDRISYSEKDKFNEFIQNGALLYIAALKHNREDVARLLRETGVDVYAALLLAIKYDCELTAPKILTTEIQNLSKAQKLKLLEQASASYHDQSEVIKALLSSNLSLAEPPVICHLAEHQNIPMLKMLQENKIDIDQPDSVTHKAPLMVAAESYDYGNALTFLLEAKANIHYTLPNGDTALHLAIRRGGHNNVEILLTHKANPDAINKTNETPLALASKNGCYPVTMAKSLIDHGAQCDLIQCENIKDSKFYQSFKRPEEQKELENYREEYLVAEKMSFHNALKDNAIAAIQTFINEKGANLRIAPDYLDNTKRPLLYYAVTFMTPPRPEIVELLLKNGAASCLDDFIILDDFLYHTINAYRANEVEKFADLLKIANLLVQYNIIVYSHHLVEFEDFLKSLKQDTIPYLFYNVFSLFGDTPFLNKLIKLFYNPNVHKVPSSDFFKTVGFRASKTVENTRAEELVFAIIRSDTKKVTELLDVKSVSVNALISDGKYTRLPLQHAICQKTVSMHMVEVLLKCGAKPTLSGRVSTLLCLFKKARAIIRDDNQQQQEEIIKIAKLLSEQGLKATKTDLQYLDDMLQKFPFVEDGYYIQRSNALADTLIALFNDPSLYAIKSIQLEQHELTLYQEYKKADRELSGIEWRRTTGAEIHDIPEYGLIQNNLGFTTFQDIRSRNTSLEKALSLYNPHVLFAETKNLPKARVEQNYQYTGQLLKDIINKKVAEQKSIGRQEFLSYLMPG